MLSPEYVLSMARYNAWQNRQMKETLETLPEEDLRAERGAFFGSIFATVNHLLWGDRIWMSRFAGWPAPEGGIAGSVEMMPTLSTWGAERFRVDSRMILWAEDLHAVSLTGALRWYSGATGREQVKPLGLCIAHMFNHQAHHRGQIHAMLTASGGTGWVSDLAFMPEEGPWL